MATLGAVGKSIGAASLVSYITQPMATPEPNAPLCPQCRATMQRTIAHLNGLPEIHIFYCAPCQCVETIKLKKAA
jgi:hypothetical protein